MQPPDSGLDRESTLHSYALRADAMYVATAALTESLELESVLDTLLSYLHGLVPYDSASVMLLEDESLNIRAMRGFEKWLSSNHTEVIANLSLRLQNSPLLQTTLEQSVILEDTHAHPDWRRSPEFEYIRNWVGVPLVVEGKAIGLYSLDKAIPGFFTKEHVQMAEMMAAPAAAAIRNARLHAQVQEQAQQLQGRVTRSDKSLSRQNERQAMLADIKIAIHRPQELQAVLEQVVQAAASLMPSTDASIVLWDNDSEAFVSSAATTLNQRAQTPARRVRSKGGATRWIVDHRQSLIVPNVQEDPFGANRMLHDYGYKAYVGVPVLTSDTCLGVLYALDEENHDYQEADVAFLQALANQAAAAIQTAYLYQEIQFYVKDLEARVANRTEALTQANTRLLEIGRLRTKFMHDVSHELRTPITTFKLYLKLLKSGKATQKDRYLNVLQQTSERLERLIEGVLQLSRLEMDKTKLNFTQVDLNELVSNVFLSTFEESARAANISLTFEPSPSPSAVWGDATQLSEAISCLLVNAITYTREGEVVVRTMPDLENNQVLLKVSDTGIGIAEEDQPHLFEPFYRGKQVSQLTIPGMGIGLTMLKEILDMHEGEVRFDSELNVGTTFTIKLPIDPPPA